MESISFSSRVNNAQKLLSSLQEQISLLPPDCLNDICADLERISASIQPYLPAQAGPPSQIPAENDPVYRMGFVLRKASAGVFVRDLVNKTVKWSPELYDLLGLDPAVPSRSEVFMNMIHPDDREKVEKDTRAAIEQGGTYSMEFRVIRPDGALIWLSSIGYVEKDENGCPLTLTGINQDITKQRLAEQAREQARAEAIREQKRLMAILEAIPIGISILDKTGTVLQANQNYEMVWGDPRPETGSIEDFAQYKAWWVESQKPITAEEWAAAQAIQAGKTVINQFLEIERFDGRHRFVLNSAAPTYDEKGQISGCVVAIRDITERIVAERALLKSERALRESEERLRVALSSLPITAYMLDENLRYTWVYNPQHGMTGEQMLGKRDDEIYPNVPEEYMAQLRAALTSGQGYQREIKSNIFGEEKYFLLSVEPFQDMEGKPAGIIGAGMDITAQRRLEEKTREAIQQVEQQRKIIENREKERQEIAREIHDGPIQTLVSMMFEIQVSREIFTQAAVQDEVLEELDKINTHMKSAVRELRDVVNNLRPPALLRFGLGKTLQVYAEDFREKHPELSLEVLFDLPDDQIYFSEESSLSLYRLCQEGLNNIARHAQASKAVIRFSKKGNQIILEITDNGKGFKVPKDLSKKMQEGHYGLAGMRERAGALGGVLKIQSKPDSGTRIRVSVPLENE